MTPWLRALVTDIFPGTRTPVTLPCRVELPALVLTVVGGVDDAEGVDGDAFATSLVTLVPTPAMWAEAPVLTSGTAITGVTLRLPARRLLSAAAGMVALQLPSPPGVVETGAVVALPSLAETDTPVASGWATPDTVSAAPFAIEPGALVMAFWAHGAIELHPEIGPRMAFDRSEACTTVVVVDPPLPRNPA